MEDGGSRISILYPLSSTLGRRFTHHVLRCLLDYGAAIVEADHD
jgi:hypothetical protein